MVIDGVGVGLLPDGPPTKNTVHFCYQIIGGCFVLKTRQNKTKTIQPGGIGVKWYSFVRYLDILIPVCSFFDQEGIVLANVPRPARA